MYNRTSVQSELPVSDICHELVAAGSHLDELYDIARQA